MSVRIQAKHTQRAEEILNGGNDQELLKLYREETLRIVLMVQLRNQERRDAYKDKMEKRELFDKMTADELFEGVAE